MLAPGGLFTLAYYFRSPRLFHERIAAGEKGIPPYSTTVLAVLDCKKIDNYRQSSRKRALWTVDDAPITFVGQRVLLFCSVFPVEAGERQPWQRTIPS